MLLVGISTQQRFAGCHLLCCMSIVFDADRIAGFQFMLPELRIPKHASRDTLTCSSCLSANGMMLIVYILCLNHAFDTMLQVPEGSSQAPAYSSEPAATIVDLRHSLEQEMALEDPYCGEIAVRNISKPFIRPDEVLEISSWEL